MSLHIAWVTETYPPEVNGVAMTVGRLVSGLRARGFRVEVFRPKQPMERQEIQGEYWMPGFGVPRYPGVRLGWPAIWRLRQHWLRDRPDLVHVVTEGPLGWAAVRVARQMGIPVTSGFHTHFDHYMAHYGLGCLRTWVHGYLHALHRQTQVTVVPTRCLRDQLREAGIPEVKVIGRGVDTDLFHPNKRDPVLRAAWGEGCPLFCLYVGRMAAEKNLALAIESFQRIQYVNPTARMIWVGEGPLLAEMRLAHPTHVFCGVQRGEALARHYASADLFLFPSQSETYGNVVAEAMASGLPVVAFDQAAAAELIQSGVQGVLVEPGDELGFVQAAEHLAENEGLRQHMAQAAHQAVQGKDWSGIVDSFAALLLQAVEEMS